VLVSVHVVDLLRFYEFPVPPNGHLLLLLLDPPYLLVAAQLLGHEN